MTGQTRLLSTESLPAFPQAHLRRLSLPLALRHVLCCVLADSACRMLSCQSAPCLTGSAGHTLTTAQLGRVFSFRLSCLSWRFQPSLATLLTAPSLVSLKSSPRSISTIKLHTLLYFHRWPIYLVVSQGPYLLIVVGTLFLRGASRLDAFSVYPFRTSLPCYAVGTTTVAPVVRPLRSSRTRSSSSHDSYAHDV